MKTVNEKLSNQLPLNVINQFSWEECIKLETDEAAKVVMSNS